MWLITRLFLPQLCIRVPRVSSLAPGHKTDLCRQKEPQGFLLQEWPVSAGWNVCRRNCVVRYTLLSESLNWTLSRHCIWTQSKSGLKIHHMTWKNDNYEREVKTSSDQHIFLFCLDLITCLQRLIQRMEKTASRGTTLFWSCVVLVWSGRTASSLVSLCGFLKHTCLKFIKLVYHRGS